MKKTYIIPAVAVTVIELESKLLADSLTISDTTVTGDNGGWAKENTNSNSSYNVWDEDWSK